MPSLSTKFPGSGSFANIVDVAVVKVLTVRLVADFQPGQPGKFPHFGLLITAERQQDTAELFLTETVKKIRLVFFRIDAAADAPTAGTVVKIETGIVAGGEFVKVKVGFAGSCRQSFEFDDGVAPHAGVGRAAGGVFLFKIVQHDPFVFFRAVENIIGNIQFAADFAGGFHILFLMRAEAGIGRSTAAEVGVFVPDGHGGADHFVTVTFQKIGCCRGIYAAA